MRAYVHIVEAQESLLWQTNLIPRRLFVTAVVWGGYLKSPCGVLVDEGFQDSGKLLLLRAQEPGCGFEYVLHPPRRTRAALLGSLNTR